MEKKSAWQWTWILGAAYITEYLTEKTRGTFSGKYYLSENLITKSKSQQGEEEEAEEKKRKCTKGKK